MCKETLCFDVCQNSVIVGIPCFYRLSRESIDFSTSYDSCTCNWHAAFCASTDRMRVTCNGSVFQCMYYDKGCTRCNRWFVRVDKKLIWVIRGFTLVWVIHNVDVSNELEEKRSWSGRNVGHWHELSYSDIYGPWNEMSVTSLNPNSENERTNHGR